MSWKPPPRKDSGVSRSPNKTLVKKPRDRRPLRFKPILLQDLLGRHAIEPPQGDIEIPDLRPLHRKTPRRLPDGTAFEPGGPSLVELETAEPPDTAAITKEERCPRGQHWHQAGKAHFLHDSSAWGRWGDGRWTWFAQKSRRWWASAGPKGPSLLRYRGMWWWKTTDLWFVLHNGQPWGYRHFSDLGLDGFIHPESGSRIVYSADGERVAVITPGQGAVLFDSRTGRVLGSWNESEMPQPRRPKPPSSIDFP